MPQAHGAAPQNRQSAGLNLPQQAVTVRYSPHEFERQYQAAL
jgi:hypothetical protein